MSVTSIKLDILEKASKSKLITEQPIMFNDSKMFGDNKKHKLDFKLFDGFGFCEDYEGDTYFIFYPRLDFVTTCKGVAASVREFMGMKDTDEITVTDIVQSFCKLHKI